MKLRATSILYRAICEGVAAGFSAATNNKEKVEDTSILLELIAAQVLRSLNDVLDFEDDRVEMKEDQNGTTSEQQ
jgi:hypothetical protein